MPVQALHLTLNTGAPDARLQPNFRERVFGEPFGFVQPTMVWNQGEVEVSGIAPGDYDLEIMHRDGAENSVQNQELNLQSDGEIDPNAGDEIQTIHGTIKFEGSDPPSNAFIQFRDADSGRMAGARVEENGDFRIQPRHTGRYVIALGNAAGYAIQSISATGAKVSGRTIDVAGSEAVELTIKASQGVGTVNGTVMNGDQPLSAAMVVLVPPDINDNLSLFRRDQSDSDGTFTLPDVVPGTYTAIAIQNGWDMEWGSPDALRPYMAKGTRIQITGKQTVDIMVVAQ
jgi:hypothetical protein